MEYDQLERGIINAAGIKVQNKIEKHFPNAIPTSGVVLGSGLNDVFEPHILNSVSIPYDALSLYHGPEQKVDGHKHELRIVQLKGDTTNKLVILLCGRKHTYEGISERESVRGIRLLQWLKIQSLFLTNAAGILTPKTLETGDIMIINDQLDLTRRSALTGMNYEDQGPRFPHQGDLYTQSLRHAVAKIAAQLGIPVKNGIYVRNPGPEYESPFEVYFLRALVKMAWQEGREQPDEKDYLSDPTGVIGMSTAHEAVAAQQAKQAKQGPVPVFENMMGISVATNNAAGLGKDSIGFNPNHNEVQDIMQSRRNQVGCLLHGTIVSLHSGTILLS